MDKDYNAIKRFVEDSVHQTITPDFIVRRTELTKQKEIKQKVKLSKMDYNFLQFHGAIWKWVLANHKIKQRDLVLLLYIHPLITFTAEEVAEAQRELGAVDTMGLIRLKRDGWIVEWSKIKTKVYYTFSNKATTLVSRLHKMYMLEEEIPTSPRRNTIARKKSKGNEQLMGLFKKFNGIVSQKKNKDD